MSQGCSQVNHRQHGGAALAVIAGLLVVAASTMAIRMARQVEGRTEQQVLTQTRMQRIQAALHAFAASQGRLPCPANGAQDTGLAMPATAVVTCANRNGTVPWVSLGLPVDDALDGWGRKISYRVPDGANGLTRPSGVGSAGSVGLSTYDGVTLLANQAWVLISHGASGLGAWRVAAPRMALPGAGGNEWSNSQPPPAMYYRREEALVNPTTGSDYALNDAAHFDDVVLFESITALEKQSAIEPLVVRLTQARLTTGNPLPVSFTGRNSNEHIITFDSGTRLGSITVTAGGGSGTVSVNADGTGIGVCSVGCSMDSESALNAGKSLTFKLATGKTADKLALGLLSVAPTLQLQFSFKLGGSPVGGAMTYPASPQTVTPGQLVALENIAPVFIPPSPPPIAPFDEVVITPLGSSSFFIASIRFCTAAENCN